MSRSDHTGKGLPSGARIVGTDESSSIRRLEEKVDYLLLGGAGSPPTAHSIADESVLRQYLRQAAARKWTVLGLTLLCALAGFGITFLQEPVYRATAVLEILERPSKSAPMAGSPALPATRLSQEAHIQTQVVLLQSRNLLHRVAGKLSTANSRESRTRGLKDFNTTSGFDADTLSEKLTVHPVRGTSLVEVLFDASSRELAVEVVNTVASEYINLELEVKAKENKSTRDMLAGELKNVEQRLEESEQKLQQYAVNSGLLPIAEEINKQEEEKLNQLENELSRLQSARIAKQSQFEAASGSPTNPVPEAVENGPLGAQQAKLLELRREIADLSAVLTPAHDRVKRLAAQIGVLESSIEKEKGRLLERTRREYEEALRNETLAQDLVRAQSDRISRRASKGIRYSVLKREAETNRNLFDALLQALKAAGVDPSLRTSGARLVDAGDSPAEPHRPKPLLNLAAGMLVGLTGGVLFVLIRANSDPTLRSPGAPASLLQLRELGVIPSFTPGKGLIAARRQVSPELKLIGAEPNEAASGYDVSGEEACLAEAYRAASISLLLSGSERVVVFTSPNPGDGKSTVVSNLGVALAKFGKKVLLIDADVHRPHLHHMFNLSNQCGLTDLIGRWSTSADVHSTIMSTATTGLSLLPSGSKRSRATVLNNLDTLNDVVRQVKLQFDFVLIDTPPLLTFTDARLLGRSSDAVVLVLRAGQTTKDSAQAAKQQLAQDGTYILGTVLTDWDPRSASSELYSAQYYAYGAQRYESLKTSNAPFSAE